MLKRAETKFAGPPGARIAYQVMGEGPVNLVYFAGLASNVDARWDHPASVKLLERLSSFSRLAVFDRRGTGVSDRSGDAHLSSWEEWSVDLTVVLDELGWERAAICAVLDAGPMAILHAATSPDRVSALALINTSACLRIDDDNPAGLDDEQLEAMVAGFEQVWGTPAAADVMYPSRAGDIEFREWYARYLRACLSPREVAALLRVVVRFDLREICRTIQAPTLVVHSRGSRLVPFGLGEDLARRIPGARFVALDGAEGSLISGGSTGEAALDAIQEFMTGTRGSRRAQRVLATLLFIDLVDSTRRAAELGDSAWRSLLEEQRWLVRQELSRHDGREIDTAGDGFLVFFDGPGRAARCAQSIVERVRTLGLEARAGLHTGECELVDEGVAGLAVHLAARVMALGGPGEVLATSTVRDLVVGSSLEFEPRGRHLLKGVPGEWEVFALRA